MDYPVGPSSNKPPLNGGPIGAGLPNHPTCTVFSLTTGMVRENLRNFHLESFGTIALLFTVTSNCGF